ncbi:MAG: Lrp/AsnC family transcriptional regulator [Rhodospirillales bacterium]|nr:Lrp/AsnC family transcriptional regulator [Rhodospirillales bacterium]
MERTALDNRLLNEYQRGFPLTPRPYADIAEDLGVSEDEVLARLERLGDEGLISRIGAVIRPNTIGASTLAAMTVPLERLDAVANFISSLPEVNHNYEREHDFNLWFVITATDGDAVQDTIKRIEEETGLEVMDLPLAESFHIDLGFDLGDVQT